MTEQTQNSKKGKPTPARKSQEAARKRPLVAPKTKEGKEAARVALKESRATARAGYLAGDDKYLPKKDQGVQRALLRDIVDSRWFTIGEILIFVMVAAVILGYGTAKSPIASILQDAVLVLFFLFIVDAVLLARQAKKILTAKFGAAKLERGIGMYVAARALYPRFMRIPKAKVKRGSSL